MYNLDFVRLLVHIGDNVTISPSWVGWQNILADDSLRPSQGIVGVDNSGNVHVRVSDLSDTIKFRKAIGSGSNISTTVYAEIIWKRK